MRKNFDLSTQAQRLEEIYLRMIARPISGHSREFVGIDSGERTRLRAGEGVSPSRTFLVVCNLHILMSPRRSSFRRNAETSTLQECAPQKIFAMAAYRPTGYATAA